MPRLHGSIPNGERGALSEDRLRKPQGITSVHGRCWRLTGHSLIAHVGRVPGGEGARLTAFGLRGRTAGERAEDSEDSGSPGSAGDPTTVIMRIERPVVAGIEERLIPGGGGLDF